MNITSLIPLDIGGPGRQHPPWGDGPPPFLPLIGVIMCIVLLLLIAAAIFFLRRGGPGRPPWAGFGEAPESEAKRVLSERFARGDISSDEFLERASVLNWTPGSEPPFGGGRKRR